MFKMRVSFDRPRMLGGKGKHTFFSQRTRLVHELPSRFEELPYVPQEIEAKFAKGEPLGNTTGRSYWSISVGGAA